MVATLNESNLIEDDFVPVPITHRGALIANMIKIRMIENCGVKPGSVNFDKYKKITNLVDDFIENYPGESGDVILDLEIPGYLKIDLRKP